MPLLVYSDRVTKTLKLENAVQGPYPGLEQDQEIEFIRRKKLVKGLLLTRSISHLGQLVSR